MSAMNVDEEVDFKSLPLEERLAHKAFEELAKTFRMSESPADPIFRDHLDVIRRLPSEPNAIVLEQALQLLIAFLENSSADAVKRIRSDLVPTLCEKGLGATKASIKGKAVECLALITEVEGTAEPFLADLAVPIGGKQPKLAAAAVNCLAELLRSFGPQVVPIKSIGKLLPAIFANPDRNVRQEGTALAMQLYRCVGTTITVFMGDLKPIQVKELQEAFSKETVGLQPSRFPRTAKRIGSKTDEPVVAAAMGSIPAAAPAVVDAFDLAEPVPILERLPENFDTLVASANWKERKEALDALLPVVKVPRISSDGHYADLVDHLVKRIADVNVLVVVSAANCLEALARGLRAHFLPFRSLAIAALLERCKEKKASVVEALRGVLAALPVQSFADIQEDVASFAAHKNPQVKSETLAWIGRSLPSYRQPLSRRDIKLVVDVCLPGLDDGATDVRDAAAMAIGRVYAMAGERAVMPFLEGVDKIKTAKIVSNASLSSVDKPVSAPRPKGAPAAPVAPAAAVSAPKPASAPAPKRFDPLDFTALAFRYSELDAEDFISRLVPDSAKNLVDPVWKTRLTAAEQIAAAVDQMCYAEGFDTELVVRVFERCWKDSNLQVVGKIAQVLLAVAQQRPFSKEATALVVSGLTEKLGEVKLRQACADLFIVLAEQNYLGLVLHHMCEAMRSQKSPKIVADVLSWMAAAITEFGTAQGLPVATLIDFAKQHLANSNASVRGAATMLAVAIKGVVGPGVDLMPMFADATPQLQSVLASEFAKVAVAAPKRTQRAFEAAAPAASHSIAAEQREQTSSVQAQSADDLAPRTDITAQISPAIIAMLGDANWKVRKEGLDQVASIIDGANRRVRLTSGELYSELRARLGDSNKILVMQALSICASLAEASGQAADRYVRSVIAAIFGCLGDGKVQVRQEALRCLDRMLHVSPMSAFLSVAPDNLSTDPSPNLRTELLTWLTGKLPFYKTYTTEDVSALVPAAIACLQDRNAQVRRAAQGLFVPLTEAVGGIEAMKRECYRVQPKMSLQSVLDAGKATAAQATAAEPAAPAPAAPSLVNPGSADQKAARIERSAKWTGPDGTFVFREELLVNLQEQCQPLFEAGLQAALFSPDFRQQIAGMSMLESAADQGNTLHVLDVLLKYVVYRMLENNPTVYGKCLDLLERLVTLADVQNYRLSEPEAAVLIPTLVQKSGESKDSLRPRLRQLFRQLCRVYPASKLFGYLIDGLRAKGGRTRAECLEEMAALLNRNGMSVVLPAKHVPLIGAMVADRDAVVRSAALNVLVQLVHLMAGPEATSAAVLHKYLASAGAKEMDMLEERMRRSSVRKDEEAVAEEADGERDVEMAASATPMRNSPSANRFMLDPEEHPPTPTRRQSSLFADPTPVMPPIFRPVQAATAALPHPLDHVIEQILTAADLPCIHAMQKLDDHLASDALPSRLDGLCAALAIRLRECASVDSYQLLQREGEMRALKARLARYVVNSLVQLVESPRNIAKGLSVERIQQLLMETLGAMLSEAMNGSEDREVLLRAVNTLLVKILDHGPYAGCFCALLVLMEQAFIMPPALGAKMPELTMKCLWKITKQMPARHAELADGAAVLAAVHVFFTAISPIEWKSRAAEGLPFADLPLRTVKTILHELVQARGREIVDLGAATLPSASFVMSYLQTMLVQRAAAVPAVAAPEAADGAAMSEGQIQDRLKDICSRICSQPDTSAALMDLWRFRREHGHYAGALIESFLASLGDFFHKYIVRSLARIDAEQKLPVAVPASLVAASSADEGAVSAAESFKARLALMRRQMFGSSGSSENLNQGDAAAANDEDVEMADAVAASPVVNRINNSPMLKKAQPPASPTATSSILGLKERLARLKEGSSAGTQ